METAKGLAHTPVNTESENTKRCQELGIVPDPQIRLGVPVFIPAKDGSYHGFVLSIDRTATDVDVMVSWTIVPAVMKGCSYSHLKGSQLRYDLTKNVWMADFPH